MFRNAVGWVDQEKYAQYLASVQSTQVEVAAAAEDNVALTEYGNLLLMFVLNLIHEAGHVQDLHLLPNDIPIGFQPWWRVGVWEAYWAGHADGMRVEYDLKNKARKG